MLRAAPKIDPRRADDLVAEVRRLAPFYAPEWNARAERGPGYALLRGFAALLDDVLQHLNRVPEKKLLEFLDLLGVVRRAPRAARVPVTFLPAPDATAPVLVPARTQVAADASDAHPEVVFETEHNLLVTPARLRAVYSVQPASDGIFAHPFAAPAATATPLFPSTPRAVAGAGGNLQVHALYASCDDLLTLRHAAEIRLRVSSEAASRALADPARVQWSYGGGPGEGEAAGSWRPFAEVRARGDVVVLSKEADDALLPTAVGGETRRWIRCRLLGRPDAIPGDALGRLRMRTTSPSRRWRWSALAGSRAHPVPPAAAVVGDELWVFVTTSDGRVAATVRDAHGAWSAWSDVPGTDGVLASPAATSLGDEIHLVVVMGSIVHPVLVRLVRRADGSWSAPRTLTSFTPERRPAVVGLGQTLLVFAVRDRRIFATRLSGDDAAPGWTELPNDGLTNDAPAALVLDGILHVLVRGTDDAIWIQKLQGEGSGLWRSVSAPHFAGSAPTVAVLDGAIVVLVRGGDGALWCARTEPEKEPWTWQEVAGSPPGHHAPIAVALGSRVHLFSTVAAGALLWGEQVPPPIDAAFHNDVPLDLARPFEPFGQQPGAADTFYLSSSDAFSKKGARVTLSMSVRLHSTGNAPAEPSATLGWDYWNGTAWAPLSVSTGKQDELVRGGEGSLELVVPDDAAASAVNGREGVWIRARVIGGSFGAYAVSGEQVVPNFVFPRIAALDLAYESPERAPERCLTINNLDVRDRTANAAGSVTARAPFVALEDVKPALHLGFDRPLVGGPTGIYFALDAQDDPQATRPRFRWEYWNGAAWAQLDVVDDSEDLTRSGIVEVIAPRDHAARDQLGAPLYWIRAVDVEERFAPRAAGQLSPIDAVRLRRFVRVPRVRRLLDLTHRDAPGEGRGAPPETCREQLEVFHPTFSVPSDLGDAPPPLLRSITANTTWASQAQTVRDEIVGSSDGRADQTFALLRTPVVSEEVWVDESAVLADDERAALLASGEARDVREPGGRLRLWVRWQRVADFLDSPRDARHYVIDRVTGRLHFGDGEAGRVPPIASDGVRVTYQFGGGPVGNVAAGEVKTLKTSVRGIDAVTSVAAAAGGAALEPLEALLERDPQIVRHRDRAMAPEDYEWLARDASRAVARVRCLPTTDRDGRFATGWVTVIVVPHGSEARPQPQGALLRDVEQHLLARCPNVLRPERLVVCGPAYVEVAVTAEVRTRAADRVGQVESAALAALAAFLHPLRGGAGGRGWELGRLVCLSDLHALLESVADVDHVATLSMQLRDTVSGTTRQVTGEDVLASALPPYALLCGGVHDVTVRLEQ